MRLGIIGTGTIVQEFLPKLINIDGLEVVALQGTPTTMDEVNAMCKANNIPNGVDAFEKLIKCDIDTVYIAVPNFIHFVYCKEALENGLNVICEKPLCSNYKESKILADLAKEKKLFLFEAITTIYMPNFLKIKEWLPLIGDVKVVQSQYSQYSRRYNAFKEGEILPAFDPNKSGGALMDLGLYNLAYIMGLFGMPRKVDYHANIERNIDTSGVMMLRYDNFVALSVAAKDCKGNYGGIIQGTNGCIKTNFPPNLVGEVTLELNDGTKETFDDGSTWQRLVPEFTTFINIINNLDYKYCYEKLELSLSISKVQTEARLQAGVVFPADNN